MAFYYQEYATSGQQNFYYRFTCGNCHKTTDWKEASIIAQYKMEINVRSGQPSNVEVQNLLQSGLDRILYEHKETIKRGVKRGYYFSCPPGTNAEYAYHLDSACPFCGQTDKIKGDTAKTVVLGGAIGVFVGVFVSLFVMNVGDVYTWNDIIPSIIAFVAPIFIGCVAGFYIARKENGKRVVHTNVEYCWEGTPPVEPESSQQLQQRQQQCRHDWFCGKCKICGKIEGYYENFGHDFVCGKCVRCGKHTPTGHLIWYDSHKFVNCVCTVCGEEYHRWETVEESMFRLEKRCAVCGKEKLVYERSIDDVDDVTYYGGSRDD